LHRRKELSVMNHKQIYIHISIIVSITLIKSIHGLKIFLMSDHQSHVWIIVTIVNKSWRPEKPNNQWCIAAKNAIGINNDVIHKIQAYCFYYCFVKCRGITVYLLHTLFSVICLSSRNIVLIGRVKMYFLISNIPLVKRKNPYPILGIWPFPNIIWDGSCVAIEQPHSCCKGIFVLLWCTSIKNSICELVSILQ